MRSKRPSGLWWDGLSDLFGTGSLPTGEVKIPSVITPDEAIAKRYAEFTNEQVALVKQALEHRESKQLTEKEKFAIAWMVGIPYSSSYQWTADGGIESKFTSEPCSIHFSMDKKRLIVGWRGKVFTQDLPDASQNK